MNPHAIDSIVRHHETKTVRQRIESYGLKKDETDVIMKKLEEGHYQIACGMHYSAVHLKDLSTGAVSHPNQWYLESRGLVSAGGEGKGGNKNAFKHLNTTKASIYASQVSQASQSTQDSQMVEMDDSELMEIMDTGTPISTQVNFSKPKLFVIKQHSRRTSFNSMVV